MLPRFKNELRVSEGPRKPLGYADLPLTWEDGAESPVPGLLQIHGSPHAVEKSQRQTAPAKPPGGETLLVVEDEADVRELAVAILESQGYVVLSASNGQEALRVFREHTQSPIQLVVSDIIMPQMDGKVMAAWLRTTDPELKVLFISGYSDDVIAIKGVLELGVEFLPKPYNSSILSAKVREVLDGPPRQAPA